MTALKGLAEALHALNRLNLVEPGREALDQAAARLQSAVRQEICHLPGEDHATPWLRTGDLHDSITYQTTDDLAVVGSNDPIAAYQELGTSAIPPRAFLAPAAAAEAEGIAHDIAERIRNAVEG